MHHPWQLREDSTTEDMGEVDGEVVVVAVLDAVVAVAVVTAEAMVIHCHCNSYQFIQGLGSILFWCADFGQLI